MPRWSDYPEFPEHYQITEAGTIRNKNTRKIIKPSKSGNKRPKVYLSVDGERKPRYVHRMVAIAFIPNPDNLPEVNHIDGNRYNYKKSNLEWCTGEDNLLHAKVNKLHKNPSGKKAKNSKGKIIVLDSSRKIIHTVYGQKQIEELGFNYSAVIKVVNGQRSSHKNCYFRR
jgi:hypothetical protein